MVNFVIFIIVNVIAVVTTILYLYREHLLKHQICDHVFLVDETKEIVVFHNTEPHPNYMAKPIKCKACGEHGKILENIE